MRYWIRLNNQTFGPYAPEQLRGHSSLTEDTLACPEGSNDPSGWKRLREFPELVRAMKGLPPLPQAEPPPAAKPASPLKDRKDLAKLIIKALGGKKR